MGARAVTLGMVVGVLLAGGTAARAAEPSAAADACAQVIVYVVRGSGEAPQSGDAVKPYDPDNPEAGYAATWDAFDPLDAKTGGSSIDAGRELGGSGGHPAVKTGTPFLYDLVEKVHRRVGGQLRLSWTPVRYPAVPVPKGWDKAGWLLGGYGDSVVEGVRELHRTIKRQWELCGTRTRYVLAGYSQGADVVTSYLRDAIAVKDPLHGSALNAVRFIGPSREIAQQIAAVALVADPNHDPGDPESYSDIDPRLSQRGGLTGFLGGVRQPMVRVTDSMCIVGDPVCGQGTTANPERTKGDLIHTKGYLDGRTYPVSCQTDGLAPKDEAIITCLADRITMRLGVRNLVRDPLEDASSAPGLTGRDVAFFIDTTGSMTEDIDSARAFARSEADRIVALDGRVALVQYRDAGDDVPVEIVTPFTSDMTQFQDGLDTLYADGGGDDPEALLHALMTGFDGLSWKYGASKAAVVLTDASFHEPDKIGGETLPEVERRSLSIDPVNVFPVTSDVSTYEGLAARTSGEVIDNSTGDTELALGAALDNIAARPTAVLSNASYYARAGGAVHFDASRSAAVEGSVAEYHWDVDGDGFVDEVTTTPTLDHTYPEGYHGLMQVLVVDGAGRSANASAAVLVDREPQRGLVPRVPGATAMRARARPAPETEDGVRVQVSWQPGATRPEHWVVTVDGDPAGVVDGSADRAMVATGFHDQPWRVRVQPMDADGNLGPSFSTVLDPVKAPRAWYARPLVWLAALVAGLATLALLLVLRRRRPTRHAEA